jgi:signal recognition particle subunit SEC65
MVNEIIDLYNSGMKMRDVAKQLNISHHKVSKVLKECGIKIRIRNDYGNPAQDPSPRKGKPYPQSIGWVCKDPGHPDKLYFIKLHNGKYKVGRSYKGWLYRKKETAELIGEWSGKSIDIWNLERKVLKEFSQYKAPLNEMSMGRGMTEHFMDTLPVQEVISFIENLKKL